MNAQRAKLPSGTRLGRYEIVDLLGFGGMGEVYRANDTRLRRAVAIKVLPAEFADDSVKPAPLGAGFTGPRDT
ncbi:MAG TPA: hypothetical protein VGY57_00275, partial [Vicinamibacterales bacterium]|nr:hypothetical protein [Vicinamibacterales bacterium]